MNKTLLVGRLGQDPELRNTNGGLAICNLNVATNEKTKDQDGNWTDATEWHKVTVFGKQAESCNTYLAKGSTVAVVGKNKTSQWTDKDGNTRYTTQVVADHVEFVGSKKDNQTQSPTHTPQAQQQSMPAYGPGEGVIPF